MKLTKEHIQKIENENMMNLIFDENYIQYVSKYMWNNYKIRVKSYLKNGELDRYEIFKNGKKIKPPNNN